MQVKANNSLPDDFRYGERLINTIRWLLIGLFLLFNNLGFTESQDLVLPRTSTGIDDSDACSSDCPPSLRTGPEPSGREQLRACGRSDLDKKKTPATR